MPRPHQTLWPIVVSFVNRLHIFKKLGEHTKRIAIEDTTNLLESGNVIHDGGFSGSFGAQDQDLHFFHKENVRLAKN